MQAEQFAENYNPELNNMRLSYYFDDLRVEGSRQWSAYFGTLLDQQLRHPDMSISLDEKAAAVYQDWSQENAEDLESQLDNMVDDYTNPVIKQIGNVIAANRLIMAMMTCWQPISELSHQPSPERKQALKQSQNNLALLGFEYHLKRQATNDATADGMSYFRPPNARRRSNIEKQLTKIDTGIVLLQLAQEENGLNAVPSPVQFQFPPKQVRGSDFIVLNTKGRAIGVKVFSYRNALPIAQVEEAIFVDGAVDLGNQLSIRTARKSSRRTSIDWAGIISAQHLQTLEFQSLDPLTLKQFKNYGEDPESVLKQNQALAAEMLADTRSQLTNATHYIGERLLSRI
jgi:hypothetical protein